MNNFFAKFLNGETQHLTAEYEKTAENKTKITLKKQTFFKDVEYVEFKLNDNEISAGDNGFYLIGAGHGNCINNDYGIGFFKEFPDCEYRLTDIYLPVFAVVHENCSKTFIVTGMKFDFSQIISVKDNKYNISLRFETGGNIPYEDISIEVIDIPLNSSYSDIAKIYREHQLNNGFKLIKDRLTDELKYSAEAINVRIRMGWKPVPCAIAEQTPENEPPVHVACTFNDVLSIIESYKKAGIEKAEFCLVGWNMKGHDGRWPQILPVESSLGGETDLLKVIKKAHEYGYSITCHTNSTDAYSIAENFDRNDLIVLKNGEIYEREVRWGGGRTYELCPKRAYEISMQTLPDVAKLGFRGLHYIDVITCTVPRKCYNKDHPVTKGECAEYFNKLFESASDMFGLVGSECSYDYALKNCDYTLYSSFADFTDTENAFPLRDKTIPFWQIVYHGIVPSNPYARTVNALASDNADDLLKLIEFGGKPQIYYYAKFVSDGTDWIGKGDFRCNTAEEIATSTEFVKKTEEIFKNLSYLQYETIENHAEISDNVFEVTYSDSSVVTVDYNNKTYSLNKK